MFDVEHSIEEAAAARKSPFVIATPNINFLDQKSGRFRISGIAFLLERPLSPVDGMPIVWIARLLGIPIRERIAGSDIFEALKSRPRSNAPLKIFLFGATEPIARAAAENLNHKVCGLSCVGWSCPGFGNIDELSDPQFIDQINRSGADFLVVALGAQKGQLWLRRNHDLLQIPVRSHLGAVINFEAGSVTRAPVILRTAGLEWLWRIKEEPALWRRYWCDGIALLRIVLTKVLPLSISDLVHGSQDRHDFVIVETETEGAVLLHFSGHAVAAEIDGAIAGCRHALNAGKPIVLDCKGLVSIDARFFGLLLMLRKQLLARGDVLAFAGLSPGLRRRFRWNGLEHLLNSGGN